MADLADAEKDQIDMVLSCIKLYKLSIDIMKEQAEIIDRLDDRTEKLVSQNEELMGKLNKLDELDENPDSLKLSDSSEEIEITETEEPVFEETSVEEPVIEETNKDDTVLEDSVIEETDFNDVISAGEDLQDESVFTEQVDLEPKKENVSNEEIPSDLKQEIKSVLSYMDQLLENLPEDKISEFAQSEHFVTYKKLFQELGLS